MSVREPGRMIHPNLFIISYLVSWIMVTRNAFRSNGRDHGVWRGSAILLSVGLSLLLAFRMIGSKIDESGVLQEPFPLLALGSLFCLAGVCVTMLLALVFLLRKVAARFARR